jgi:hypothetical protein
MKANVGLLVAADIMRKMQILPIVVVVSWMAYAAILVLSMPIPPEAVVGFSLSAIAALVGISAGVAAVVNARLWRILALTAAVVFLVGYAIRLVMLASVSAQTLGTSLFSGLATVLKDSWLIAQDLYQTSGIMGAAPYTFSVVMPVIQLVIIWLLLAGPKPPPQGTRDEAARR